MKNSEILSDAIGMIDDEMLMESDKLRVERPKKKTKIKWFGGAVAACTAIAVGGFAMSRSGFTMNRMIAAKAVYPMTYKHSNLAPNDKLCREQNSERLRLEFDTPMDYYKRSAKTFLGDSGSENVVFSPLDIYMSLSMLAETTDTNSRAQILDLLGSDNISDHRAQAQPLWNANYRDDGEVSQLLANSLWLNDNYSYNKSTVNTIADSYYATVYRGNFGDQRMTDELQSWLNKQTNGLLKDSVQNQKLSSDSRMSICSAVYFDADWSDAFQSANTKPLSFHTANGDVETDFMYQLDEFGRYFWHDSYTASYREYKGGGRMWFILPDNGVTVDEVLQNGDFLDMMSNHLDYENAETVEVHYYIPKFDISSDIDMKDGLKELGVTDIFDGSVSDFSPLTDSDSEIFVGKADHSARIIVDESGVEAASFTKFDITDGGAAPIGKSVEFRLSRPFIFAVQTDTDQPLFIGVVNNPK